MKETKFNCEIKSGGKVIGNQTFTVPYSDLNDVPKNINMTVDGKKVIEMNCNKVK
jgi:hypothetical protein